MPRDRWPPEGDRAGVGCPAHPGRGAGVRVPDSIGGVTQHMPRDYLPSRSAPAAPAPPWPARTGPRRPRRRRPPAPVPSPAAAGAAAGCLFSLSNGPLPRRRPQAGSVGAKTRSVRHPREELPSRPPRRPAGRSVARRVPLWPFPSSPRRAGRLQAARAFGRLRSTSLAAQAGPAATMRPGRAARASGVTVMVMKPGPVTSARAMPAVSGQPGRDAGRHAAGCSPEANATLEAYCPGVPVGRRPGSAGPSPSAATARAIARRTSLLITAATRAGRRPARGPRGSSRRDRMAWSGRRPRRRWRRGRCRLPGRGR